MSLGGSFGSEVWSRWFHCTPQPYTKVWVPWFPPPEPFILAWRKVSVQILLSTWVGHSLLHYLWWTLVCLKIPCYCSDLPVRQGYLVDVAFGPGVLGSLSPGQMAEKWMWNWCEFMQYWFKAIKLFFPSHFIWLWCVSFHFEPFHHSVYPVPYHIPRCQGPIRLFVVIKFQGVGFFLLFDKATLTCLWAGLLGNSLCCAMLLSNLRGGGVPQVSNRACFRSSVRLTVSLEHYVKLAHKSSLCCCGARLGVSQLKSASHVLIGYGNTKHEDKFWGHCSWWVQFGQPWQELSRAENSENMGSSSCWFLQEVHTTLLKI